MSSCFARTKQRINAFKVKFVIIYRLYYAMQNHRYIITATLNASNEIVNKLSGELNACRETTNEVDTSNDGPQLMPNALQTSMNFAFCVPAVCHILTVHDRRFAVATSKNSDLSALKNVCTFVLFFVLYFANMICAVVHDFILLSPNSTDSIVTCVCSCFTSMCTEKERKQRAMIYVLHFIFIFVQPSPTKHNAKKANEKRENILRASRHYSIFKNFECNERIKL